MPQLDLQERQFFDEQGYLILRNVLSQEEIAKLNEVADRKSTINSSSLEQYRDFFICRWSKEYLDLVDHPRILPYLEEFVGPTFRLDHDYCIFMNPGCPGGKLHGGEPLFSDFWYRKLPDGTIRSGMTVVTFFLSGAGEGDGGFVVIPGSHREPLITELPEDVIHMRSFHKRLEQPVFQPGDAVIFPEGVVHGTMKWTAPHQRRVLLYKYTPGHIAWLGNFYDETLFEGLSPRQSMMMRPPYVDRIKYPNGGYRTPTLS